MSPRALGRLLRLSLAPTAVADVAAGLMLCAWYGAAPSGSAPWLLVMGSLCVYHGGMALNDWADRKRDHQQRPDRPLPSGAVSPRLALAIGLVLLTVGPVLAGIASRPSGLVLAAVAVAALSYDLGPRGPWMGPGLLAFCRAGNVAVGIFAAAETSTGRLVALIWPVAYGLYVLVVSRLGRFEDGEEELDPMSPRPRRLLVTAAGLLFVPAALMLVDLVVSRGSFQHYAYGRPHAPAANLLDLALQYRAYLGIVVAGAASMGLIGLAIRTRQWTREIVERAMGMSLRRLLIYTATLAMAYSAPETAWVGPVLLLGYPISHALRRVFPPS